MSGSIWVRALVVPRPRWAPPIAVGLSLQAAGVYLGGITETQAVCQKKKSYPNNTALVHDLKSKEGVTS